MRIILLALMALALVASSVHAVYVQHERRTLFVQLQQLERERDQLQTEWGQLRLEESAWTHHDRIRRIASEQLNLHLPASGDWVVVESAKASNE